MLALRRISIETLSAARRFAASGLECISAFRLILGGGGGASCSRSEAFVGGEEARGDDLVGDVFLLLKDDEAAVPREFTLASEGRCFSRAAGKDCLCLMRFDSGVPELELESSSSRGLLTGAGRVGALTGGRPATMTVSLTLEVAGFGFGLKAGGGAGASSPEVSELTMISCDRIRLSLPLEPAPLLLVGDAFGAAGFALGLETPALEGPSNRLACASWLLSFFALAGRGLDADRDIFSPPAFLSLSRPSPDVEPSSAF